QFAFPNNVCRGGKMRLKTFVYFSMSLHSFQCFASSQKIEPPMIFKSQFQLHFIVYCLSKFILAKSWVQGFQPSSLSHCINSIIGFHIWTFCLVNAFGKHQQNVSIAVHRTIVTGPALYWVWMVVFSTIENGILHSYTLPYVTGVHKISYGYIFSLIQIGICVVQFNGWDVQALG